MIKKVLIALCLLCLLTAGCNQNKDESAANTAATTTTTLQISTEPGSQEEFVEPKASDTNAEENGITSSFVFAVQADSHLDEKTDIALYQQTLQNIKSAQPAFLIDLGDTFMAEKKATTALEVEKRYVEAKSYFDTLEGIPLYLVTGNHEGENGWDPEMQRLAREMRHKYFPADTCSQSFSGNTDTANYYSFVAGDAQFIILDPFSYSMEKAKSENDGWDYSLGNEQYDWLKSILENSTSKYKFVFIHNLVGGIGKDARGGAEAAEYFEWGGNSLDGIFGFDEMRPGWGVPIARLLSDNNVTAVFHGHDHFYAKQNLDGIVYQLVPQPGTPGNSYKHAAEYSYVDGVFLPSAGYIQVTVTEDEVTIEYVKTSLDFNKNAEIADLYAITQGN